MKINKSLWILAILFLMFSMSGFALSVWNNSFDTSTGWTDSAGTSDFTTFGGDNVLRQSVGDEGYYNLSGNFTSGENWTVTSIYYMTGPDGEQAGIGILDDYRQGPHEDGYICDIYEDPATTGNARISRCNGGTCTWGGIDSDSVTGYPTDTWLKLVFTKKGTNLNCYVTTLDESTVYVNMSGTDGSPKTGMDVLHILNGDTGNDYIYYDEIDIDDLVEGAGAFKIDSATYTGYSFNSFNATVNGTTYGTSNGTINTNMINGPQVYNVDVFYENDNYKYYETYSSWNITNDLTFNYSAINFTVIEYPYNTTRDNFTVITDFDTETTTTSEAYFYTNETTLSYDLSGDGYLINKSSSTSVTHGVNNIQTTMSSAFVIDLSKEYYYNQTVLSYSAEVNGTNYTTTDGVIKTLMPNNNNSYTINFYPPGHYNISYLLNAYQDQNATFYKLTNKIVNLKDPLGISRSAFCYYNGSLMGAKASSYTFSTYQITNTTMWCQGEGDFKDSSLTIVDDNSTQILTLQKNVFYLTYANMSGDVVNVNTLVRGIDENGDSTIVSFNEVNFTTYDMINIDKDYIYIDIGENWTEHFEPTENGTLQEYQFEGDSEIEVIETLYILDEINGHQQLLIKDQNNKPVKEGIVRVYAYTNLSGNQTEVLINQVLIGKDGDGLTSFSYNNEYKIRIEIIVPGKVVEFVTFSPSLPPNNPMEIEVKDSEFPATEEIKVFMYPNYILNTTNTIRFSVTAVDVNDVFFTNDYINTTAGGSLCSETYLDIYGNETSIEFRCFTLTKDEVFGRDYYFITLQAGTHYNLSDDNFTAQIWIDKDYPENQFDNHIEDRWTFLGVSFFKLVSNNYWYKAGEVNLPIHNVESINPTEELANNAENSIVMIALIFALCLIAIGARLLIPSEDESVGLKVFLVGSIIIAGINLAFATSAFMAIMYFIGKWARGFYGQ